MSSAARLDRDRDGLLVFFVGVVFLRVAAAVYFLTDLLVAAAPVVMLTCRVTIPRPASNTSRRVVGQWGGAGGACCEDHLVFCGELWGYRASRVFDSELAYIDTLANPKIRLDGVKRATQI